MLKNQKAAGREFYRLFISKESSELLGRRKKNFFALLLILYFTFFAIGFGEGGMEYLELKMADPFINWVNIPVPYGKSSGMERYRKELNEPSQKAKYHYNDITKYVHFPLYFLDKNGEEMQVQGRTIEPGSPLLRRILTDEFLKSGISFNQVDQYFNNNSIGLIISQELLQKLGYEKVPAYINMSVPVSQNLYRAAPLPIIAVAKQLPGMVSVMVTPFFYYNRYISDEFPFDIQAEKHSQYLRYFIDASVNEKEIFEKLKSILDKQFYGCVKYTESGSSDKSHVTGKYVHFDLEEGYNANKIDSTIIKIVGSTFVLQRIYEYDLYEGNSTDFPHDYLSIDFKDLEKLKDFSKHISRTYDLKIDMALIDSKENFSFISRLSNVTSVILIIFSIISVIFFVNSLIRLHFEKIKKNIGTFKAFGLSNKSLILVYTLISLRLVFIASIIAITASFLTGTFGGVILLLKLSGFNLEPGFVYFNIITVKGMFAFFSIPLISLAFVYRKLQLMLISTPGDLIYERN